MFQLIDVFLDGVRDMIQHGLLGTLDIAINDCLGAERLQKNQYLNA